MAIRILGVAPTVGKKGVSLKVGESGALHLIPLHAPGVKQCSFTNKVLTYRPSYVN